MNARGGRLRPPLALPALGDREGLVVRARPGAAGGDALRRGRMAVEDEVVRTRGVKVGHVRRGQSTVRRLVRVMVSGQVEREAVGGPLEAARERSLEGQGEKLEDGSEQ